MDILKEAKEYGLISYRHIKEKNYEETVACVSKRIWDGLISEVERLRQNQLDRNKMEIEMENEIEALTKERDEWKRLAQEKQEQRVSKWKMLEVENAELKDKLSQRKTEIKGKERSITNLNKQITDKVVECEELKKKVEELEKKVEEAKDGEH